MGAGRRAERVLVLGATSAIAAEVALVHARRGDRLYLAGRNAGKLAGVAERCAGAAVATRQADFLDTGGAAALIGAAWDALGGIDAALLAHGDLGDQLAAERSYAEAEQILQTNLLSAVALLVPLANRMEAAGHGRIGVITSVAAERGRPRNYTYGAAKGALNVYLQGLRSRLYPSVSVTTLKLGPVDTPMTRDHPKNALFGQPEPVARAIVRALEAGVPEAFIPSIWRFIMPVVKRLPEALFQSLPFLSGR